jgi:NADPH2:quinone reductase
MKAVLMTKPGPIEVLSYEDIPEPAIERPTQVKVRLRAAGINPVDTKLRSRGVFFPDALPTILGCDGAGEVVEVGAEVTELSPGDAVWFCHGGLGREQGNYAEYTVIEASEAARKPESLSFEEAAAAPLILLTAWESLHDRAHVRSGQDVLIHAGAGGVGHVAIQLAALAGARVLTTVGNAEKAEFVLNHGASHAIPYHEEDFVEAVNALTSAKGADVILDTVGGENFRHSIYATAHYGDLITLLEPGEDVEWKEARNRNLRIGFELMLTPMLRDLPKARAHQVEILEQCGRLFDEGKLRVHVAETLPLAEAAKGHAMIEEGHTIGKLVLVME